MKVENSVRMGKSLWFGFVVSIPKVGNDLAS